MQFFKRSLIASFIVLSVAGCQQAKQTDSKAEEGNEESLRSKFKDDFLIGTALGVSQILGENQQESELIAREFNVVTPENVMKWELIHPAPDTYDFVLPDSLVALAEKNNQQVIGHNLTWHSQAPDWLFEDEKGQLVDSLTLYARMKEHISTVVGRYKGRIKGWDVLNEALNEDGTLRNSKFYQISGEGYIFKAFEYANAADPEMELYYNDYNMNDQAKVDGAVRIVEKLKARGLRVDGIGMQGHWSLDSPTEEELESSIEKIAKAGVKVMITELDLDVLPNPYRIRGAEISDSFKSNEQANPYVDGLPDSVNQKHADQYEFLFKTFYKHRDKIDRVTFWGVHDGHSWKNNWPARGRTNYCLIFDRNLQPKLAYDKIIATKEN